MAFPRPTLPELIDTIRTDLVTRLGIVTTVLRRALVRILSVVFANEAHDLHGHLDYNSKQIFVSTADADNVPVHGNDLGVPRKAATYAAGLVDIVGAPDGTTLPAGSGFQRDDGVQYLADADAVIAGGVATVAVTALVNGLDSNADAGTALTLTSTVAGIQAAATVNAAGITGGVDLEDLELYRGRILTRKRKPPAGGNLNDYLNWMGEIPGVTRSWPIEEGNGPGTVLIYFVTDDAVGGLIPDAGAVTAAQAFIDDPTRHILGSHVTVAAPVANVLNITAHIVPDTTANRAAVTAELQDLVFRSQEPGATIPLSQIRAAVEDTAGITDSAVSVPAADFTSLPGQIPTFGVITWV